MRTSVKTEEDAKEKVRDFLARIPLQTRQVVAPTRKSTLLPAIQAQERKPKRTGNYIAGPGQGIQKKVREVAADFKEALLLTN